MKRSLKTFIIEARQADVAYVEKKAKNAVVKVIAELKGHDASVLSQLARRFDRLKVAIEKMTETRDKLNSDIKGRVVDLFDAEDKVLTRVVDTAGFTMTLSAQATKGKDKVVVNWEEIAKELVKLVPDELQAKVDEIQAAYTKSSIMDIPSPGLRVDNKAAKAAAKAVSVEEGIIDSLKKLGLALKKRIDSWGKRYDKTMQGLQDRLDEMVNVMLGEELKQLPAIVAEFEKAVNDYRKAYPKFTADNRSLRKTLALFKVKKYKEAAREIDGADTIVREVVPEAAWQTMHTAQ